MMDSDRVSTGSSNSTSENKALTKSESLTFEKLKQKWKELSEEDIILDGLYLNCIRLVQEYFEKQLKVDLSIHRIVQIGLKSALQLLADRDLRWAEKLFNNMNFDANTKISQICFYTPYKELRDYLAAILIDRKLLSQEEIDLVDYLKNLETVYTCRSYAQAKQSLKIYRGFSDFSNNSIKVNENFTSGELVKSVTRSGLATQLPFHGHYGQYVFEWLREWTLELRAYVLLDGLITNKENYEQLKSFDQNLLWNYLVENLHFKLINEWFSYTFESSNNPHKYFSKKLDQEMIDYAFNYLNKFSTTNIYFNYIAKAHNVFSTIEKNNFRLFINRLSTSVTFIDYPKDENFHIQFIKHILKYYPISYVWSYMDYYNYKLPNEIEESCSEFKDTRFQMVKEFRNLVNDESNFYQICVKNIEENLNEKNIKMENLFERQDFHFNALALSFYSDTPLSSTSSTKLTYLLEQYPALRLIIDNNNLPRPISLYNLLEEHTKIDLTKFFTWQMSNKIAYKDGQEQGKSGHFNQLLSFDNIEFSSRYLYKDNLDYSYFIKQGRPFFAYYNFVMNQLTKYGKIHKTLMEEARLRTHIIAIKNYENSRILSSTIIFSELINGPTFKIKLNVHIVKHILFDYYKRRGLDEKSASLKSKLIFIEFLKGEIETQRFVSIIENALVKLMVDNFDLKKMFTVEACSLWLPIMCFCKLYNLPYSSKYLSLCAESNQWLMYLIFSQIYQIPRFQVISNLEYFTDIGLKQHLEYALHNVITSPSLKVNKSENQLRKATRTENSRKRTKVKKVSKKPRQGSDSSESANDFEFESEKMAAERRRRESTTRLDSIDFYELLINCQNSQDPVKQLQLESLRWHTPVLAVFATFYPQHDKISCLCTFLFSSLKQEYSPTDNSTTLSVNTKSIVFNLNDLKVAIQSCALRGFLRTLLNAFKIFIPGTILEIYVDFLYYIFLAKDGTHAQQLYQTYKYELIKVTLSKHQSYVPLEWYEDVINKLTRITILKCRTINDLNTMTNILGRVNEYRKLIKLVYTLKNNKLTVNIDDWLTLDDKSDQFNDICFKVIEELLKIQKFDEAEELADYCELSKDRIHLARIARQIEILRLNNDFEEILEFWKTAHVQLIKIGIKDTDFIGFLKFQNSRSNLTIEKIVLLNLICQLCPNDQDMCKNLWQLLLQFVLDYKKRSEMNNLREVFKKMFLHGKLQNDPVKELIDTVMIDSQVIDFNNLTNTLNDHNVDGLNILLFNLIDIGKLAQAYVIANHFKYFNQDLRILLNMIYICLDMLKPEEIDYSTQTFDSTSFKGIKLTNVLRSLSRGGVDSTELFKDRIDSLEKLAGLCNHGSKYCQQIKLDFRLANEVFKIDYIKVLKENHWSLFKQILYSNSKLKYDLAKEFASIYELNQPALCIFLLDEILPTIKNYVLINRDIIQPSMSKQFIFNPNSNEEFSKLIKIFDNSSSLFGTKLLEKTKALLVEAKTTEDYMILTELLIRSHDCFLQSCSMEGISNVLIICKQCASILEKAGEFNIMIRLLTGIGHFSEMTYIMDFLWNNHQFEMLFGKGIGKDEKLRLALLDYLKRYHPNDHETYTMVTLNFTMHREIAKMLEDAAYQQLKVLDTKPIENTSEILTDLQSILQYFSDAAQSYMKDDCVKQAESCIRKARLIALQINFLSSNRIIINLNSVAVSKFIISHPKFWEAYIVNEAYDKKSDWAYALFNQYIMCNNEKYLNDFKAHIQLTTNIIEEVANRFKIANDNSKLNNQAISNMKKLLKYTKDISIYYKLATQLDFKDLIQDILSKNYSSIINDLISNKKLT